MNPEAIAADNPDFAQHGVLSMEQAIRELAGDEEENNAPATAVEAPTTEGKNTEAAQTAEGASEPETVIEGEGAETDGVTAEGEQPVQQTLTPPRFWDAEDKDAFGRLSREDQERVLKYDAVATKATSEALERAANARKVSESEASKFAQTNGVMDKLLPELQSMLKSRWDNVDWDKVIQEQGAETALRLQNQMTREVEAVKQLETAKRQADQVNSTKFKAERFEKLKTIVPELADDKAGAERQLNLVRYISTNTNIPPDDIIENATAEQLAIAHKAMRFDQAEAKAKTLAAQPKPPAQPARPALRPSASTTQRSPQSARIQALQNKPRLSMEEATELLVLEST